MIRKTLLSVVIASICLNASALEILEYDQYAEGNIAGIVPVDIRNTKGVFKINVTGATKPYAFSLQKTETGINILLENASIDGPAGFIVGVEHGKDMERKTFMVNANTQPLPLISTMPDHLVKKGEDLATIAKDCEANLGGTNFQRAMAIVLLNQDAFTGGDINKLERGRPLVVPNKVQVASLDSNAARRQFMGLAENKITFDQLTLELPEVPRHSPVIPSDEAQQPLIAQQVSDIPVAIAAEERATTDAKVLKHINMLETRLAALEMRQNVMAAQYKQQLGNIMTVLEAKGIRPNEGDMLVQNQE